MSSTEQAEAPVSMVLRRRDIDRRDARVAGGKGANVGELLSAGLPVPDGFVVTARAYLDAMERAGVRERGLDQRAAGATADVARPPVTMTTCPSN